MTGSMELMSSRAETSAWDLAACELLWHELSSLRDALLDAEARLVAAAAVPPSASARNLAHYLALRRHDLRSLQDRLAAIGLSSLGRAEAHVLANVDKVLGALHALCGRPWNARHHDEPAGYRTGRALLAQRCEALFGPAPPRRATRVMVTLPSEAATDPALVGALVAAGMDIARINCAHDDAEAWSAMAGHVRDAARAARRPVRVMMDLAGPKIRTGAIEPGASVLKIRPQRDALGAVVAPALLQLRAGTPASVESLPTVGVDGDWLGRLREGDRIEFSDARGRSRHLVVLAAGAGSARAACKRSAYLVPQTRFVLRRGKARPTTTLGGILPAAGRLRLQPGEALQLTASGLGANAGPGWHGAPAHLACTLPEALRQVRKGEQVWFDDGRIGGIVSRVDNEGVGVQIVHAPKDGAWLAADKGINLPETRLDLPALTEQDLADLEVVVRLADIVALSFAQSAADVDTMRDRLLELDASQLGIVLKVETRRGFEHLPDMLYALMPAAAAGVMIARGDLAVECGFERLAEVQEEILWACEAAHMPVIWATQVLESQARAGRPSRAEVTDAAMGARADCVMLNKGPHIVEAIRALDDILRRMQRHQSKKSSLLRALKSWAPPSD